MTEAQAAMLGWHTIVPVVGFVMLMATYLIGLSILKDLTR